jgi:hypothetical protein
MKLLQLHIARKQAEFSRHEFFQQLESGLTFEAALAFAPDLTFWVMTFQDILRLNETFTRDPDLRRIARHHRTEDAGHERWFLDDLAHVGGGDRDIPWLFGKKNAATRDAAYALMAEVYRANDDRLRLGLLMTLESSGHVFFERTAKVVERAGKSAALRYFSFSHLEVEKNHEVFERAIAEKIDAIYLAPSLREQAEAMVDRCYDAFGAMFGALAAAHYADLPALAEAERLPRRPRALVR